MTFDKNRPANRISKFVIWVIGILFFILFFILFVGYLFLKVIVSQTPGAAFGGAGFYKPKPATHVAIFHVEPQIVYRLDDYRYVELENYENCQETREDRWGAKAYYYDTQFGIKTKISARLRNFKGKLINADPSGKNIAFAITPSQFGGSERGKGAQEVLYSTDYGRTFASFYYTNSNSNVPARESEEYTVVITDKELAAYDGEKGRHFVRKLDFNKPLSDGGGFYKSHENRMVLPDYSVLMDSYQCNRAIKSEIELMPIEEYKQKYGDNNE